MQETYSLLDTIGRWEAKWGGKIVSSLGSSHSRGVMILFKPRLDVNIEKITSNDHRRYILALDSIFNTVFINPDIYFKGTRLNDPERSKNERV